MPLYGTLTSMPLPDLLQWLCNARVTGSLEVERERVSKSISLQDGRIVGCSSDDPPQRLGHFLLSRGQISEEQLREALQLQEIGGQHLGMLLVQLGALSPDELSVHLEAQAEETIYSLFDWDDAMFRFRENENDPANVFPISLRVEDVLLRGLQRFDEMREIRGVFNDPGIVLEATGKEPASAVTDDPMGRSILELLNGERTVAEILLQVHGSEYVVTKLLFELHRSGAVRISRVKPIAAHDPMSSESAAAPPSVEPWRDAGAPDPDTAEDPALDDLLSDFDTGIDLPVAPEFEAAQADSIPVAEPAKAVVSLEDSRAHTLEHNLEKARRCMAASEFEKALEILDPLHRDYAGEESLRRLTAEADAAFVEKAYRHYLPPRKVLVLTRMIDALEAEDLSPSEFFLLSRIDGTWDIKSIIQIAPLRESDTLRTLKRMRENGLIDLRDP